MIPINKNPSRKELLIFSAIWPVFGVALAAMLHYKFGVSKTTAIYTLIICAGLGVLCSVIRPLARIVFVGLIYITFPIGFVVSILLLAVTFFIVMTPIGLLLRLFGKDPMHRRPDKSLETYWIKRPPQRGPESYFKQH